MKTKLPDSLVACIHCGNPYPKKVQEIRHPGGRVDHRVFLLPGKCPECRGKDARQASQNAILVTIILTLAMALQLIMQVYLPAR